MQTVVVDMIPNGNPPICYASANDNRREILVILLDNGVPRIISDDDVVVIDIRSPDNKLYMSAITNFDGNRLYWRIYSGVSHISGRCSCRVRVITHDPDSMVSSSNFLLEIEGF